MPPVAIPTIGSLPPEHAEKVFELWDDLSGFGVEKTDLALKECMERICGWLDAQDAFWVGAVRVLKHPGRRQRDPLSGWRIRTIQLLHPEYHQTQHYKKLVKEETHDDLVLAATNIALANGAGQFRAYTLRSGELIDLPAFKKTAHYDFYYRQSGVRDRIWVVAPINPDTESYFCFDRIGKHRRFKKDDLALAAFALRGIKWFHRQLMLHHGLGLSESPLTPAERRVLKDMLGGATERDIAEKIGLSPGTVHQYAIRIYRKFGVRSRAELSALWLSGKPA